MDFDKLTLGDKIAGGCGIVLVIGLLFLPWHSWDFGGYGGSYSAVEGTNQFWAYLALLLTLAVVGTIIVTKLTSVELPELPIPLNQAIFFATIATTVLLILKLILETNSLGWGAWLNIILAGGMTYGGFLISQDTGSASTGESDPKPF